MKAKISGKSRGRGAGTVALTEKAQEVMRISASENELGRVSGNLDLIIGGPLMLSVNSCVSLGLANGTKCTLVDLELDETAVQWSDEEECYVIGVEHVSGAVVKHVMKSYKDRKDFDGLPAGCFPVEVSTIDGVIKSLGRKIGVRTTQLPLVPLFAITGHKCQGQTEEKVVVGPWTNQHRKGSTGWLYVVLSRVRRLQDIYLIEPLSEDPSTYQPRIHIDNAMIAAKQVEQRVLSRMSALFKDIQVTYQCHLIFTWTHA